MLKNDVSCVGNSTTCAGPSDNERGLAPFLASPHLFIFLPKSWHTHWKFGRINVRRKMIYHGLVAVSSTLWVRCPGHLQSKSGFSCRLQKSLHLIRNLIQGLIRRRGRVTWGSEGRVYRHLARSCPAGFISHSIIGSFHNYNYWNRHIIEIKGYVPDNLQRPPSIVLVFSPVSSTGFAAPYTLHQARPVIVAPLITIIQLIPCQPIGHPVLIWHASRSLNKVSSVDSHLLLVSVNVDW